MPSSLSANLQEFLHASVSSYEELEALLLLVQGSDRSWADAELAEALKVDVHDLVPILDRLASVDGLLVVGSQSGQRRLQYAPKSLAVRQVIEELATAYVERRLAVMQLMSENALARVRSAALRSLANAFRLERPKK